MQQLSIKRYMKQLIRGFLGAIEKRLTRQEIPQPAPVPILIIALPRSGSTLLYQLIAARFDVCYFQNYMKHVPEAPVSSAAMLSLFVNLRPDIVFKSDYGESSGWRGPSQGYEIWNRWLPPEVDWIPAGYLAQESLDEMRRTILSLQKVCKAPFLNKWQRHSLRIGALHEAFPDCIFVNLKRDPAHVALSILRGRRRFLGDEKKWLSARPRACENVEGLTPIEQVCAQVHHLEKEISEAFSILGPERYVSIQYEDLCENPVRELDRISKFYAKNSGSSLVECGLVPRSLELGTSSSAHDSELSDIRTRLARLKSVMTARTDND